MIEVPARVVLLMDHPAQQFVRALQLLSEEKGIDAQVCYWSVADSVDSPEFGRPVSWDIDLLAGYNWWVPRPGGPGLARVGAFFAGLRSARPEVVVCYGWASLIARAAILYCFITRTRILLYSDSTWQHSASGRRSALRWLFLRVLMRVCAGAISTGTFNREFYIRYGMDPRRIWPGVCPADTQFFAQRVIEPPAGAGSAAGRVISVGYAGKLIPRKGVEELLRAAAMLPRDRQWMLTVVGDGPLRVYLEGLAGKLGLADRVLFHGFANTTEMPKLLAAFDIVVVPSLRDMRVLVAIEAMAAGAAVVVSDATAVWGPGDLIEDGVTGLVYPAHDPMALADRLRELIEDRSRLAAIRTSGGQRAARFGPESFAATMSSAIRMCLAGS